MRYVVDLTCEFAESDDVMRGRSYLLRPILDAAALPSVQLQAIADEIKILPGPVYIHCAQGHGRTGMVAAAVLLASGRAATADSALAQVCAVSGDGTTAQQVGTSACGKIPRMLSVSLAWKTLMSITKVRVRATMPRYQKPM